MVRRLIGFLTADATDEEIDEFIARAKKMGEDPDSTPPTAFIRLSRGARGRRPIREVVALLVVTHPAHRRSDTITEPLSEAAPRSLPQRSRGSAFQAECRGFDPRLPLHSPRSCSIRHSNSSWPLLDFP